MSKVTVTIRATNYDDLSDFARKRRKTRPRAIEAAALMDTGATRCYLDGLELGRGLSKWFLDYNESRPHRALNYACPEDVYRHPEAHGARTMK